MLFSADLLATTENDTCRNTDRVNKQLYFLDIFRTLKFTVCHSFCKFLLTIQFFFITDFVYISVVFVWCSKDNLVFHAKFFPICYTTMKMCQYQQNCN